MSIFPVVSKQMCRTLRASVTISAREAALLKPGTMNELLFLKAFALISFPSLLCVPTISFNQTSRLLLFLLCVALHHLSYSSSVFPAVILFLSSAPSSLSLAGCQPALSVTLLCLNRLNQAKHREDLLVHVCMFPAPVSPSLFCSNNVLPFLYSLCSSFFPSFIVLTSFPHLYHFLSCFLPNSQPVFISLFSLHSPQHLSPLLPSVDFHLP